MAKAQVKPKTGGSFTDVPVNSTGEALKTINFGFAMPPGNLHQALFAVNTYTNCSGQGTHAARAVKILTAQGASVQWV